MLELREKDREIIIKLLAKIVPKAEVWGYGSRVKGDSHAASDFDLVLRNPIDLSVCQTELVSLKEALSTSDLPILVDVVDWARIPEAFRQEILNSHCLMQHAKTDIESAT
jgi:predicted nucleotidyltransferase